MSANQNQNNNQQQSGNVNIPQQVEQKIPQQQYCPPMGYKLVPINQLAVQEEKGISMWQALGLVGIGFILGQWFAEDDDTPQQPNNRMPWQK